MVPNKPKILRPASVNVQKQKNVPTTEYGIKTLVNANVKRKNVPETNFSTEKPVNVSVGKKNAP